MEGKQFKTTRETSEIKPILDMLLEAVILESTVSGFDSIKELTKARDYAVLGDHDRVYIKLGRNLFFVTPDMTEEDLKIIYKLYC